MDISAAIYEEITGLSAAPPPADEAGHERRKHQRLPFGFRANISVEHKGETVSNVVMIRDISLGGLSFLNDESLKTGMLFIMEFRGHEDRPVQIRCSVSRCAAGGIEGTEFIVGATFEEVLTEELVIEQPAAEQSAEALAADALAAEFEPETPEFIADAADSGTIEGEDLTEEPAPEETIESPEPPAPAAPPVSVQETPANPAAPEATAAPPTAPPAVPAPATAAPAPAAAAPAAAPKPAPAKPAPVKPVQTSPAPAAKPTSSLFTSSKTDRPQRTMHDVPSEDEMRVAAKPAAKAPPPEEKLPTFRDVPMDDAPPPSPAPRPAEEKAPTFKDVPLDDAPPPSSTPRSAASHLAIAHGGGKAHEVLARVKERLVQQEQTIKKQQQQFKAERDRAAREMDSLRANLADLQKQVAEMRTKVADDDSAIAELESFLEHGADGEQSQRQSEAA